MQRPRLSHSSQFRKSLVAVVPARKSLKSPRKSRPLPGPPSRPPRKPPRNRQQKRLLKRRLLSPRQRGAAPQKPNRMTPRPRPRPLRLRLRLRLPLPLLPRQNNLKRNPPLPPRGAARKRLRPRVQQKASNLRKLSPRKRKLSSRNPDRSSANPSSRGSKTSRDSKGRKISPSSNSNSNSASRSPASNTKAR